MPYLRCARCGLQFKIQAEHLRIENCPRCLARSAIVVPLTPSAHRVIPAVGWGALPDDDPNESTHTRSTAHPAPAE